MIRAFAGLSVLSFTIFATPAFAGEGLIDVKSNYKFEETADRLSGLLEEKKMTLFKRIDHSTAAAEVGVDLRPTVLFIFGNPKAGSPLMKCRQSVAIDLPQKALIWEDEAGEVWISYNAPAYLAQRHSVTGCEQELAKIEEALAGITAAAAN